MELKVKEENAQVEAVEVEAVDLQVEIVVVEDL